jgi:hypothetical protein
VIWYEFFCDESSTHGRPDFWLGGLRLTPEGSARLRNALIAYKKSTNIPFEMKWTSISNTYLRRYFDFVDLFLNDISASFKALHITKGPHWRSFGRNEEERFFKSYYVFFKIFAGSGCRYDAYLDYKTSKWYRWKILQFALNGSFRRDWGARAKTFRLVSPVDSKADVLLQLTDIILGALQYRGPHESAKGRLAQHILAHCQTRTRFNTLRIHTKTFSPSNKIT